MDCSVGVRPPCRFTGLNAAGERGHDLTPFFKFALRGIERQCQSLFAEIREQVAKALYWNTVTDLFGRLQSPRKRVVSERHAELLKILLKEREMETASLFLQTRHLYTVKNHAKAFVRDFGHLLQLGAISIDHSREKVCINLDWPTQITETEFFQKVKSLPKGKVYPFLTS